MHFAIPDTSELNDKSGSTYKGYNVYINGIFHCTVRYKQLFNLHEQLRKEFGNDRLPTFPPKKLLPLTNGQVEERRALLEKYIQTIGQDPGLVTSRDLMGFLLSAQQETFNEEMQEAVLNIYTMNNSLIPTNIYTYESTNSVLSRACKQIHLPPLYVSYFALFLVKKEDDGQITLFHKFQEFESPYITLKNVGDPSMMIVIRKSYWDNDYDLELMNDPVALNLIYTQSLSDLERGWILCTRDTRNQLAHLQARLAKREYVELARNLKYYGFLQFSPCHCDYPKPNTEVLVAIGSQELSLRLIGHIVKEGSFKVTRMRCWRITATQNHKYYNASNSRAPDDPMLELSFEYLMSKDKLQWITITSEQAILMSVCLQSMVDELLMKKNGLRTKQQNRVQIWSYMNRDGSVNCHSIEPLNLNSPTNGDSSSSKLPESFSIKKLQENFSSVSFKSGKEFVENNTFEGIGDDDL